MANPAIAEQEVPFYHEMNRAEMIRVIAVGLVAGILVPLLSAVLQQWVIVPVFCQDPAGGGVCNPNNLVAYYAATLLVAAVAAPLLIGWGVFRALLIVVGATLTLWGLQKYVADLAGGSVFEYYAFSAMLFAACYALFYWLMRLRNFGLSVVLAVVVVAAVRWALLI